MDVILYTTIPIVVVLAAAEIELWFAARRVPDALFYLQLVGDSYAPEMIEKGVLGRFTAYSTLRMLERRGLVRSFAFYYPKPVVEARGGRPRRYYRLTPYGQLRAAALVAEAQRR